MPRKNGSILDSDVDAAADTGPGGWTRGEVKSYLERHYSTRLHMSAILAASGLVAMLASSTLLSLGVTSMMVRYPIGIALAYATFLVGIFVWLRLVGLRTNAGARTDWVDAGDAAAVPWSAGGGRGGGGLSLPKGGGTFDGGGASAAFVPAEEGRFPIIDAGVPAEPDAPISKSLDLGNAFDGEAIALLLLAALLVMVVFATSGYLIWIGPDILAEAAFGAMLAGGLARRTSRETATGWIAGVVRKTWWPFAVVLVAAVTFAGYAAGHFPEAHTFKECLAIAFR